MNLSVKAIWSQIDKQGSSDCWPFKGKKNRDGYGIFSVRKRKYLAHRVVYELAYGFPIKQFKWQVQHSCNNPACCNPKHLLLGTHQDNMDYMLKCGRGCWQSYYPKLGDLLLKELAT